MFMNTIKDSVYFRLSKIEYCAYMPSFYCMRERTNVFFLTKSYMRMQETSVIREKNEAYIVTVHEYIIIFVINKI